MKTNTKPNQPKEKVSLKFKRWFFGLGKEFNRVNWSPKKKVLMNFFIVLSITIVLALLFLFIDWIVFI
ncbi:MAG: preprotein translocase subunit SecE [Mycoplasmataceae bacterium]|nr:preprotein translocase subunit SecE [Mycoplasmataceae bacterium]